MTSEITSRPSSDDFELSDTARVDVDDDLSAIAAMLSDSYNAPEVPRSLTQRLDSGISERWGHSPELVESRPVTLSFSRVKSLAKRSRWLLGAAASVLVFAAIVSGGSGSYT